MSSFSMVVFVFVLITTFLQIVLALKQMHFLQSKSNKIPIAFKATIKESNNQKAIAYNLAKLKFSILKNGLTNTLLVIIISSGFLNFLILTWNSMSLQNPLRNAGFLLTIIIIRQLIELPFSYWKTFIIEQSFGFNTMSLQVFLLDFGKQLTFISMLSMPILILICWLIINSSLWWLWIWTLGVTVTALLTLISPMIKSRFFYKRTLLNTIELIEKIEPLLSNYGFTAKQVYVINSSSRTQHSNAHFVGFGPFKRILLSDTLMNNYSFEEITAIIAHELGHYFRQHILKYFVIISAISLIGFMLVGWMISSLGLMYSTQIQITALFLLLYPLIYFWFSPLLCKLTRHYEHDADDFAGLNGQSRSLQQALIKLYSENASLLKSDPWYSFWFDTHPSPQLRITAIQLRSEPRP